MGEVCRHSATPSLDNSRSCPQAQRGNSADLGRGKKTSSPSQGHLSRFSNGYLRTFNSLRVVSALRRSGVVRAGGSEQALEKNAVDVVLKRANRAVGEEEVDAALVSRAPIVGGPHMPCNRDAVVGRIVVRNQKRRIIEGQVAETERAWVIVKRHELI